MKHTELNPITTIYSNITSVLKLRRIKRTIHVCVRGSQMIYPDRNEGYNDYKSILSYCVFCMQYSYVVYFLAN